MQDYCLKLWTIRRAGLYWQHMAPGIIKGSKSSPIVTSNLHQGRSLEETADRLRRAQKAGRLGTWDWNVVTNELIWDGVEAVHGLPDGSFGGSFEGYLADMHPEDRERVLSAIGHARETGSEVDIEYRIVLPDGSYTLGFRPRGPVSLDAERPYCADGRHLSGDHRSQAHRSAEGRPLSLSLRTSFAIPLRASSASPGSSNGGWRAKWRATRRRRYGGNSHDRRESQRMAEILETFLDLARAESSQLEVAPDSLTWSR